MLLSLHSAAGSAATRPCDRKGRRSEAKWTAAATPALRRDKGKHVPEEQRVRAHRAPAASGYETDEERSERGKRNLALSQAVGGQCGVTA